MPRIAHSVPTPSAGTVPWSTAWHHAQYGAGGFYQRQGTATSDHFRTSAQVAGPLAVAVCQLLDELDEHLGHPAQLDLIDVGAGEGTLLKQVLEVGAGHDWTTRLRPVAVELRDRPANLDRRIEWLKGSAPTAVSGGVTGLLMATELLDDLPCEVIEADSHGQLRIVLVDQLGRETLGPRASERAGDWLARWWPGCRDPGARSEVGSTRDALCRELTARVKAGTALFIDYPVGSTPPKSGTLVGYRTGHLVRPIPDGQSNITSSVVMEACVAAVADLGECSLATQRDALLTLLAERTRFSAAEPKPTTSNLASLVRRAQLRELTDPSGLGAHQWLIVRR